MHAAPGEIPSSLPQLKLQEPCQSDQIQKRAGLQQLFNCCYEEGTPPGSPYIQMTPAEIPMRGDALRLGLAYKGLLCHGEVGEEE